ncbi:MAG: PHP domain-containing protein [Candidatus Marinimicrobia bacterium]|nr:PHP domain-containing protein [Candidatus Neomarinimicrobiota bacterium]
MTITLSKMTPTTPDPKTYPSIVADMHIHSTASDGEYSPTQIAEMLHKNKIEAGALADHDSFAGFNEFKETFKGVAIPGVELSVQYNDVGLHLLSYGFDPEYKPFIERLEYFQKIRYQRIESMCDRLSELGKPLTIEEVKKNYSSNTTLGRPHIARALIAKGYIKSFNEAFHKYIGDGKPAYVPKARLDFEEALELIKASGGISILAHPGLFLKELSFDVMKMIPVNGFEAYHPHHSSSFSRILVDHCLKHDLPYTGGSDFHDLRHNKTNVIGKWGLSRNEWLYVKTYLNNNCSYQI